MTRIVHFNPAEFSSLFKANEEKVININLTISGSPGNYRGAFDKSFIVTTSKATRMSIQLVNETNTGASISILDYATTGMSESNNPIEKFSISEDRQSAEFTLSMLKNQLIDFGLSIIVQTPTPTGLTLEYLFCDPQASNDPKLSQ